MEQSTQTGRIGELIARARQLDQQAAEVAEAIHRVHVVQEGEVRQMPGDTDAVDLAPWYQASGIDELRTVAVAIGERLEAAVDEARPGDFVDAVRRQQFDRHGLTGFGIDPYDEYLAESTGVGV